MLAQRSFNEAAASHRGKREFAHLDNLDGMASMRPRHHTAENFHPFEDLTDRLIASMRPRHHTAENLVDVALALPVAEASMRPRHHTAENRRWPDARQPGLYASMRPRHHTAENSVVALTSSYNCTASMRPRHHTAENWRLTKPTSAGKRRFNEAAASHRGKPEIRWTRPRTTYALQ